MLSQQPHIHCKYVVYPNSRTPQLKKAYREFTMNKSYNLITYSVNCMTITALKKHVCFPLILIWNHITHWCQKTSAIPSTCHIWGKHADVPPLICTTVPHYTVRKMLPLFPEMSQMLLTLLHRREHLTLTQCSSRLCLICIGALFSFSRQTPHWCASPSR